MRCQALAGRLLLALAAALVLQTPSRADLVRTGFGFEPFAWKASHVVIVQCDTSSPSRATVVESWHGDLEPGAEIEVGFLQAYQSTASRAISTRAREFFGDATDVFAIRHTSLERVLLLLRYWDNQWLPANPWDDSTPTAFWLDNLCVYAPAACGRVVWIPGVYPLGEPVGDSSELRALSEAGLRAKIDAIIGVRRDFHTALSVADPAERVVAVQPFLDSDVQPAVEATFRALEDCGEAAVPLIRTILADDTRTALHHAAVHLIAEIRGAAAGAELAALLDAEVEYHRRFDHLPPDERRQHVLTSKRLGRLHAILHEIRDRSLREALPAVREFRTFWTSRGLENTNSWPNAIDLCDDIISRFGR